MPSCKMSPLSLALTKYLSRAAHMFSRVRLAAAKIINQLSSVHTGWGKARRIAWCIVAQLSYALVRTLVSNFVNHMKSDRIGPA